MSEGTRVERCRSCGKPLPAPFLDLGATPVANRLLERGDDPEESYPLLLSACSGCTLVQLGYELTAAAIFGPEYPYYSSFSESLVAHARRHAEDLISSRGLGPDSLVVEIGSNDGYLLRHFVERGIPVLGIEPSPGPAAAARAAGVDTIEEFFGVALAERLVAGGRRADVIVANNVMAHVPDLNGFVAGLRVLVADKGIVTIENPSVVELIRLLEFDTVYHEHYCYFSCTAVDALTRRHGLSLFRVEDFEIHGGSHRWWVRPLPSGGSDEVEPSATSHLEAELAIGIADASYYAEFDERVRQVQQRLVALLQGLKSGGASLAAYGAAAKGATLLNSAGIGLETLDFVVDRNVHKQGRWMPGARLPILPVDTLLSRRPDYVLLLAWNFAAEIRGQQTAYEALGGRFIVPVPEPEVC